MTEMPTNEPEGVRVTQVASTPSSLSTAASPDTLQQLEFSAALGEVARRAVSPLGAARVMARRPRHDAAWVGEELGAVGELAALLLREDPFRPETVPDLSDTLAALAITGSVLESLQLVALARAVASMRLVARELGRIAAEAPRVARLAVEPPPRTLEEAITRALDQDGGVRDAASPDLKKARRLAREARARLIALLEELLRRLSPGDRPAGAEVTVREGRYVIPVPRGGPRVFGIVHGESGSGSTLFVEPQEAVELGNELRSHEADEARAVLAVLRGLTDQARAERAAIAAGWEMCVAVDDLYARARYACDVRGSVPVLEAAPAPLILRGGRHPLLIGEGAQVVPFDLSLSGDTAALVISGPNTGGKTVLLKAVGLIAGLAQAGVVPPVAEGTRLPLYRRIFADIGDHQSIAASLSTFSAHAGALRGILAEADAGSLVLVDEIGSGTDPAEGGALAGAALLALVRRRAATIVTTHLAQLKDVAARTPGVENGSLEFDAGSLTPTYRFLQGVPGRSYGLAVARRLGMPSDVLSEADALLPEAQRTLEALLADLEARRQQVERREREAGRREAHLAARGSELVERSERLERQEQGVLAQQREVERTAREQARQFLLEARRRVEEALGVARAAVTEATAKEARRLVEEGVQHEAEELKKLQSEAAVKGWRMKTGKGKGEKGKVKQTPTAGLKESNLSRLPFPVSPEGSDLPRFPFPVSPDVDLRGLTADEAIAELNTAIDAAVVNDLPSLRIIHGKGTGVLRAAVQGLLSRDSRVAGFRLAPPPEGGSGVTIVELKA